LDDLAEELERLFQNALVEKIFSAASLAVTRPDQVLFARCWGTTRQGGTPVDEQTHFDLASLTKPLVTASLCIWAVSTGRLALDDRLDCFLPKTRIPASKRPLSIRHLLNHSSGLPAYSPFYTDLIRIPPPERREALLSGILDSPLEGKPGIASHYSDLGFILLGMLLEDLLGNSLDSLAATILSSSIFSEELHYCRMDVDTDPSIPSKRLSDAHCTFTATEYCSWRKRFLLGEVHDENAYCLGGVAGHAGLFGTVYGVVQWLRLLHSLYRGERQHLDSTWSSSVMREFWDRTGSSPEGTWVLGFDTPSSQGSSAGKFFSPRSIGHLGFTGTSFWLDLEKDILIVLLTNRVYPSRSNDRMKSFRPLLHDLIMKGIHGA
jgi:CubicO group peptidase (beta-lactamase class C family)